MLDDFKKIANFVFYMLTAGLMIFVLLDGTREHWTRASSENFLPNLHLTEAVPAASLKTFAIGNTAIVLTKPEGGGRTPLILRFAGLSLNDNIILQKDAGIEICHKLDAWLFTMDQLPGDEAWANIDAVQKIEKVLSQHKGESMEITVVTPHFYAPPLGIDECKGLSWSPELKVLLYKGKTLNFFAKSSEF